MSSPVEPTHAGGVQEATSLSKEMGYSGVER